jgi:hypothetical protein
MTATLTRRMLRSPKGDYTSSVIFHLLTLALLTELAVLNRLPV